MNLVQERVAYLSEALPAEVALAEFYGFVVRQPRNISSVEVRRAAPDRLTIGATFYHAMATMDSSFILVLEKDFSLPASINLHTLEEELLISMLLIKAGAFMVRLRSQFDSGCSGFRSCEGGANKPDWHGKLTRARRRNWFSFYCEPPTVHNRWFALPLFFSFALTFCSSHNYIRP